MTDARPARRLAVTGAAAAALTALAVFGVFFVAPEDADQGIIQKIFYFHVAIAIASLLAFAVACVGGDPLPALARRSATTRSPRSSVGIGLGFAVLVVITGLDLGQGLVGHLVGLERPAPGDLPDRAAALRRLLRAALVGRGRAAHAVLGDLLDRGLRVGAAVVLLGAGGALVRAPGGLHPERREHAGHDAGLVRRQPARGDRRLPHDPAARAAPAPRRQGAAPRQAAPGGAPA